MLRKSFYHSVAKFNHRVTQSLFSLSCAKVSSAELAVSWLHAVACGDVQIVATGDNITLRNYKFPKSIAVRVGVLLRKTFYHSVAKFNHRVTQSLFSQSYTKFFLGNIIPRKLCETLCQNSVNLCGLYLK